MGTGNANGEGPEKCTPSLRRNYPVQVQRVLSQPEISISTYSLAPRGKSLAKIGYLLLHTTVTFAAVDR